MSDRWWSGWNWNRGHGSRQWDRPARSRQRSSSSAAAPAAGGPAAPAGSGDPGGSSELGPGTSSSQLREKRYAKQVKNWKRGLLDRLGKYLAANGGFRNADILAFIESDCNYTVYSANRDLHDEDCRKNNKPVVRRVREDKFGPAAIAIQRCAYLASRTEVELKDVYKAVDDKVWTAWREKHGIEEMEDDDGTGGEQGEPPASAEAAFDPWALLP